MKIRAAIIITMLILLPVACVESQDDYQTQFSERSEVITNFAAELFKLPKPNYSDPEKVYWPVVIARFHKYGINDSLGNALLDKPVFKNKLPFHFILVGMARIMPLFDKAPAMSANKLQYLKNIASRKDSYNPWTCEGTENHINMSRTSGLLFAELMLDYPDLFPEAEVWKQQMKEWLKYYHDRILLTGTAEFNASTYGVFNIIGFLNLYDFSNDAEVREMAKNILDYYALELAMHYFQGMTSGAESRGAPSKKAMAHETEWLSWLWFGQLTKACRIEILPKRSSKIPLQAIHAVTSHYRPPKEAVKIANRDFSGEKWYTGSKPSYLLAKPGYIPCFLYRTSGYSLGSAMYPYGAYGTSAYKNTTWKLLISAPENKRNPSLITGNGGYYKDYSGKIRNPYTQVAQHKNVLILLNRLPDNYHEIHQTMTNKFSEWRADWEKDFIQRFSARDDKIIHIGNPVKMLNPWFENENLNNTYISFTEPDNIEVKGSYFLEYHSAFVKVTPLHPIQKNALPRDLVLDQAPVGELCGFAVEVSDASDFTGFDDFIRQNLNINRNPFLQTDSLSVMYHDLNGNTYKINFTASGEFSEPIYDWGYGPTKPSHIHTSPPYIQPDWPEGDGFGRIPEIWINEKQLYTEKLPVYSGPDVQIKNRKISYTKK